MAARVAAEIARQLPSLPRAAIASRALEHARCMLVADIDAAIAVANAYAPEHLSLQIEAAARVSERIDNAGAVFVGAWSAETFGDYVCGPSHVLPTYGSARFASALTVADFCKDHHVVTLEPAGIQRLGPHVVALADAEGLTAHADSVRLRLDLIAASTSATSTERDA